MRKTERVWCLVGTGGFIVYDIGTQQKAVYRFQRFARRSEPHRDWRVVRATVTYDDGRPAPRKRDGAKRRGGRRV